MPAEDATEDEIAEWFAEVDLSELELEEVWSPPGGVIKPAKGLQTVSLRLPAWEIEELKRRAERLGVGYTTYIRLIVNRHLLEEQPVR